MNLTKQQIFDLEMKYQNILPSKFKNDSKWWTKKRNWKYLSIAKTLPDDFIKEFKDYLDWFEIYEYQTLSEEFLREFKDFVDWDHLLIYQELSKKFIEEMRKEGYIK